MIKGDKLEDIFTDGIVKILQNFGRILRKRKGEKDFWKLWKIVEKEKMVEGIFVLLWFLNLKPNYVKSLSTLLMYAFDVKVYYISINYPHHCNCISLIKMTLAPLNANRIKNKIKAPLSLLYFIAKIILFIHDI